MPRQEVPQLSEATYAVASDEQRQKFQNFFGFPIESAVEEAYAALDRQDLDRSLHIMKAMEASVEPPKKSDQEWHAYINSDLYRAMTRFGDDLYQARKAREAERELQVRLQRVDTTGAPHDTPDTDGDGLLDGLYGVGPDGTPVWIGPVQPMRRFRGMKMPPGQAIESFEPVHSSGPHGALQWDGKKAVYSSEDEGVAVRYAHMKPGVSKVGQIYDITLHPTEAAVFTGGCDDLEVSRPTARGGFDVVDCHHSWLQPETLSFHPEQIEVNTVRELIPSELPHSDSIERDNGSIYESARANYGDTIYVRPDIDNVAAAVNEYKLVRDAMAGKPVLDRDSGRQARIAPVGIYKGAAPIRTSPAPG